MADTDTKDKPADKVSLGQVALTPAQTAAAVDQDNKTFNAAAKAGAAPSGAPPADALGPGDPLAKIGVPGADIDKLDQATADAQKSSKEAQDYLKSHRAMYEAIINNPTTHPKAPSLQAVPDPPVDVRQPSARVFGQFLPVLAMLGGLTNKYAVGAALNAGAAAMEAAKSNDKEKFQRAHDQWEDKVKTIIQNNESTLSQYQAIMADSKMTAEEKQAQLAALFASEGNELAQANLANGQLGPLTQMMNARVNALKAIIQAQYSAWRQNNLTPTQKLTHEEHLRAELYKNGGKQYEEVQSRLPKMEAIYNNPDLRYTVAGQNDLLDSYFKMLNDGQALRQFGLDNLKNHSGVDDKLDVWFAQLQHGHTISKWNTDKLMEAARDVAQSISDFYQKSSSRARDLAIQEGLDPKLATYFDPNASLQATEAPEAPDTSDVPTIMTQQDYDALPSGSAYLDSAGNYAVKP